MSIMMHFIFQIGGANDTDLGEIMYVCYMCYRVYSY